MTAVQLAEAATLGGVLVDPGALPTITAWLRPGDFTEPWNSQLFALLCERQIQGASLAPEDVGLALLERVGPHRADLVRVVSLLRATPPNAEATVYARMVLESSLRRDVAGLGILLRASAIAPNPAAVERGVSLVAERLREGEGRWQQASGGSPSPSVTHPEPAPPFTALDRHLSADRLVAAHPPRDAAEITTDEQRLVAALICHPEELPAIEPWLRPEMLTDHRWAAAYRAVLELAETRQPIDVVTVTWGCEHAVKQHGPGPAVSDLLQQVSFASAESPTLRAQQVARDVLRRTAETAANCLRTAAGNPGLDVSEVLETARLVTEGVHAAAVALEPRDVGRRKLTPVPDAQPAVLHLDGSRSMAR